MRIIDKNYKMLYGYLCMNRDIGDKLTLITIYNTHTDMFCLELIIKLPILTPNRYRQLPTPISDNY